MLATFMRTLYLVCVHYHSGQSSKGYRLLCLTQRYANRWGIPLPEYEEDLSPEEQNLYPTLVERHAHWL